MDVLIPMESGAQLLTDDTVSRKLVAIQIAGSVCCSMFAGDFQSTDPSYLINSSEAVGLSVVLIVKLTLRSSRIDQGSSIKFRSINPPRNRSTRLARNPTPAISQQSWESGQAR